MRQRSSLFFLHDLRWHSPAQNFLCRIECHRKTGDKKVGEGEADEKVVVDAAEARVEDHGEDDEEVGEDGGQDHQHQRDRLGGGQHADDCELGQIGILLRKNVFIFPPNILTRC